MEDDVGADTSEGSDEPPSRAARTDGQGLLYVGKRHWLQGEPESGKTFLALFAASEALRRGEWVVFVDFEDSGTAVRGRLQAMRTDLERFVYVHPAEPLEGDAVRDVERLMALEPTITIFDGVAEAMALHDLDPRNTPDVAVFMHEVVDRFTGPDVTTVLIDHVVKGEGSKGRYAYGSQHKLAAVDGVAYRFEVIQMFSRDQGGAARIDVVKDRPGFVRSFALGRIGPGVLRVVPDGEELEVTIEPPTVTGEDDDGLPFTQRRVVDVLDHETNALTYQDIGDRLATDGKGKPLKRATIQHALDDLVEMGLADGERTRGGEPSRFWRADK